MEINPSIFRSYDIRGIYPKELNEEIAYKIGQVFVDHIKAKTVVAGRDMRISSSALFEAFTKGVISKGADIYDLGEIPTEFIYFTVEKFGYDGGTMVTASHNPKEYNGFKIIKRGEKRPQMLRGKLFGDIIEKIEAVPVAVAGNIFKKDVWQDYMSHIFSFIDVSKIKPFRVVVDAGNGMAGKVIPKIIPGIPIEITPLNFKLDGNFPAHPSNPLQEHASDQVKEEVMKRKADFGFIFDGDADRIYLIDEIGNFVPADTTLLLLARYFLQKNPGAGIAYNLICSRAVPEFIKKWGGKAIRTPVGFINVMEGMAKNNGVMGGELSGHYCYKDNFYSDSGFISFLVLLQIISENNKRVSELTAELSPYFKAPEINFRSKNKEAILEKFKENYSDGKQDYLDGLTVDYDNWWFNLRSSQTEPISRLTVEAETKELLEEKKKELTAFLTSTDN